MEQLFFTKGHLQESRPECFLTSFLYQDKNFMNKLIKRDFVRLRTDFFQLMKHLKREMFEHFNCWSQLQWVSFFLEWRFECKNLFYLSLTKLLQRLLQTQFPIHWGQKKQKIQLELRISCWHIFNGLTKMGKYFFLYLPYLLQLHIFWYHIAHYPNY